MREPSYSSHATHRPEPHGGGVTARLVAALLALGVAVTLGRGVVAVIRSPAARTVDPIQLGTTDRTPDQREPNPGPGGGGSSGSGGAEPVGPPPPPAGGDDDGDDDDGDDDTDDGGDTDD